MFAAIIAALNRLRLLLLLVLTIDASRRRTVDRNSRRQRPTKRRCVPDSSRVPVAKMGESSRSEAFPGNEIFFTDREYFSGPSSQNRSLPSADQRAPAFADSGRTSRLQGLRAAKHF
ncbi:hypothetical protein [Bradyrhizobium sp. Ec3.3]|uniref:hypothetical protein n=1 Tax=Bradyrhizobium sp. Ec3.3 TaxID=189753 RepID=UPI0012EC5DBF|nr:hypothetical protein [Bradyrhizobium sp. Ec3.3]